MKTGRPKKDLHEFDKELVEVKLSFNQITHLLEQFKLHQPSSVEGQITKKCLVGLKKYLLIRAKQGKLPQDVIDKYVDVHEENFVDKSTIQPKEEENE